MLGQFYDQNMGYKASGQIRDVRTVDQEGAGVKSKSNAAQIRAAKPKAKKEKLMKQTRLMIRMLGVFAIGLMFVGTAQAQTQESKISTAALAASVNENTEVCIFKISGKDDMVGMMCSGCTGRVETALLGVDGIISVDAVDLETGTATVTIAKESQARELIPAAISEVNFVATLVEEGEGVEKTTDN